MKDHSFSDLGTQSITSVCHCKRYVSHTGISQRNTQTTSLQLLGSCFIVSSDLNGVHNLEIKLAIFQPACLDSRKGSFWL